MRIQPYKDEHVGAAGPSLVAGVGRVRPLRAATAERPPRPYPAGGIACLNRNLKSGSYVCFTWRRRGRFDA
jgi:hypothetical protein